MTILRIIVAFFGLLGTAACAELDQQRGLTGLALDKVMLADSKKMDLLRAEIAMMFLSYAAVDSGEHATSDNIGTIAALNRTTLSIDCIRSAVDPSVMTWRTKDEKALCPDVGGLYFFDTRMVSVDRDLLSLARTSLPTASLSKLLSSLPNASAQPLALVMPVLAVARDAVLLSQRGFAVYRDSVEIQVDVYCSNTGLSSANCGPQRIENGRHVGTQREFIASTIAADPARYALAPGPQHYNAARALTAANCQRPRGPAAPDR
jgi:hypothetical protein